MTGSLSNLPIAIAEAWRSFWLTLRHGASPLTRSPDGDHELDQSYPVWIGIGNISLYLKNDEEGASVTFYGRGIEDEDSICESWCSFHEASAAIEYHKEQAEESAAH